MKYIVFTWHATGNCWMTDTKAFDNQEEAIKHADEKAGIVIKTDFYYSSNNK